MWDEFELDLDWPVQTNRSRSKWDRSRLPGGRNWKNSDFRCMVCQSYVSAAVLLAGVRNRNHCPYCLWSKHLDQYQSGDRMAICKASMRPVALTLKQTQKKYASSIQGELMLVHFCESCEKISINRIAADDDPERILAVMDTSRNLDQTVRQKLNEQGIQALESSQRGLVISRLFGSVEPYQMEDFNLA